MYQIPFHNKPLTSSSFLVTGGAGFIGSHLVAYLLKYGAMHVRVMDNMLTGKQENVDCFAADPRYEFQRGDLRNTDDCKKACSGMDYVLHQGALVSVQRSMKEPAITHAINADGFLNMLLASRDEGIKRLVYASSSSVYGDHTSIPKKENRTGNPLSPYAVTKKTNELYAHVFAQSFGMQVIGLRYFNVYGPRQDAHGGYAAVIPAFIRDLKAKKLPVIYGDGSQTRDFTFVEDAVQANIKALFTENPDALGQVFNVAYGAPCSIIQLFRLIAGILPSSLQPRFEPQRTGDILHSTADTSQARMKLDYHPNVSLEAGLRKLMGREE